MADEVAQLKQTVESLQKVVTKLNGALARPSLTPYTSPLALTSADNNSADQEEVRKLQYKYGYYLDKCLYQEVSLHGEREREYMCV